MLSRNRFKGVLVMKLHDTKGTKRPYIKNLNGLSRSRMAVEEEPELTFSPSHTEPIPTYRGMPPEEELGVDVNSFSMREGRGEIKRRPGR